MVVFGCIKMMKFFFEGEGLRLKSVILEEESRKARVITELEVVAQGRTAYQKTRPIISTSLISFSSGSYSAEL